MSRSFNERLLVMLLCIAAVARVFVYSAAFPFFNGIDEEFHFDLLVKYSMGHVPHGFETLSDASRPCMIIYSSPEYFLPPDSNGKYPPPLWHLPPKQTASEFKARFELGRHIVNHESGQPPLYYALAGLCWRLGSMLGLDEGTMLYNIRFLNMLAIGVTVWLGFLVARLVFPDRLFVRIGVPALLAFMPQSAFYAIENDVLSPVCFGTAFLLLLRWLRDDDLSLKQAALLGLALAATFLTKLSNMPLVAGAMIVTGFKVWHLARKGTLRPLLPSLAVFAVSTVPPIAGWLAWMNFYFGDFTGAAAKAQSQGWTCKTFAEWWDHPIFTPAGLWVFVSRLLATFWHGELVWHRQPMVSDVIQLIYVCSSLALVGAALAGIRSRIGSLSGFQRRTLWLCLGCPLAIVAFLGSISILYDFNDCINPSREHPFFSGGRLVLGATIPFFVLVLCGLDRLLDWIKIGRGRFFVLAGIVLFMLVEEVCINWPVFSSLYNWYHI